MVFWRVMVVKSLYRMTICTDFPLKSLLLASSPTSSARLRSTVLASSMPVMSLASVVDRLIDLVELLGSGSTGESSMPLASLLSSRPYLPKVSLRILSSHCARSPIVSMPIFFSRSSVLLPIPYICLISRGHIFSGTSFFQSSVMPRGFFISEAILARNLFSDIPIEHHRSSSYCISFMMRCAIATGSPNSFSHPVRSSHASSMLFFCITGA